MKIKIFIAIFIAVYFFAMSSYAQQPITTAIQINEHANSKITNDIEGKVILSLFSKGAVQMQISNESNFEGARWQAYDVCLGN
jgi:hypothetical protein